MSALLIIQATVLDREHVGAFFARGESQLAPEHFLAVLGSWTRGATGALPESSRRLFWLLSAVEEADRWQPIIQANWADLWRRLGRDGEPPALDEALAPLVARALVQVEQAGQDAPVRYRVHPGVAEAARQDAGEEFQAAVDAQLAAFWQALFGRAVQAEGGEASRRVVHAGRAAAPYLLRLGEWAAASTLLEQPGSGELRDAEEFACLGGGGPACCLRRSRPNPHIDWRSVSVQRR